MATEKTTKKVKMTKEIIIQKIKNNWERIETFGVKSLWLFGSYAKNEQKWGSDVDFIVEFKKDRGHKTEDFFGLIYYLEKLLKKNVDLGEKEELKKDFRDEILNEAIICCNEGIGVV